jgi:hypothetical protein
MEEKQKMKAKSHTLSKAPGEADRGLPDSPLARAKMLYRGSLGELNPVDTSLSGATFSQAIWDGTHISCP